MDKYLKAIKCEEGKLEMLKAKLELLSSVTDAKKVKIGDYSREENKLKEEQEFNEERKDFLENKKTYLTSFFIAALKFGGKSSLFFWGVIVLITILDYNLGNTLNLVLSDVLLGNVAISAILGYVEFYSVSQYFYSVLRGYKGNIDNDIELTNQRLDKAQQAKEKLLEEVRQNDLLFQELEQAIKAVSDKILELRSCRNGVIEALIAELDIHIKDFQYQESDIEKVLEKKIQ